MTAAIFAVSLLIVLYSGPVWLVIYPAKPADGSLYRAKIEFGSVTLVAGLVALLSGLSLLLRD